MARIFDFLGPTAALNVVAASEPSTSAEAPQQFPTCSPCSQPAILNPSEMFALFTAGSPGFIVKDNFMPEQEALDALTAAKELEQRGKLHAAGMGSGQGNWKQGAARGDKTIFLSQAAAAAHRDGDVDAGDDQERRLPLALAEAMGRLERVRSEIASTDPSPEFQLENKTSTQLAYFDGNGARYVRHRDASAPPRRGSGEASARCLTAILYLNHGWKRAHGGCLRLHLSTNSNGERRGSAQPTTFWDVEPVFNRLVIFRSAELEHEVLPTAGARFALTSWLYGFARDQCSAATLPSIGKGADAAPTQTQTQSASDATPVPVAQDPLFGLGWEDEDKDWACSRWPQEASAANTDRDAAGSEEPSVEHDPSSSGSSAAVQSADEHPIIFVSIASYRDSELAPTLRSLFERAVHPDRIRVGVCCQYKRRGAPLQASVTPAGHEDERDVWGDAWEAAHVPTATAAPADGVPRPLREDPEASPLPARWARQIRVLHLDWREARGPCFARRLVQVRYTLTTL
jgi:hypothetical protein